MPILDKVPGELQLFIGGLFTVRRTESLQENHITHMLTVLNLPVDQDQFKDYVHKTIAVDDVDDENLLEHFPDCIQFIQSGLDAGGGVLVHCAMGKSRSATVICAYLMYHYNMTPDAALAKLREARPFAEPNDGFWKQLQLYHSIGPHKPLGTSPLYQKWLFEREMELSRACGLAPEADKIRFEDEHEADGEERDDDATSRTPAFELRCRKCRRTLATSTYILPHTPKEQQQSQDPSTNPMSTLNSNNTSTSNPACAHHYLDPLSWMRPTLQQGHLSGRLECPNPKCGANVGKYAWQGQRCSCGAWIVPGISLVKGRVDEVRVAPAASGKVGGGDGGEEAARRRAAMGIRLPPGGGVSTSTSSTKATATTGGGGGGGGGGGRKTGAGAENL